MEGEVCQILSGTQETKAVGIKYTQSFAAGLRGLFDTTQLKREGSR
jgi:hypothetical protein